MDETQQTTGSRPSQDCASTEQPAIPGYEILEVLGRGGMGVVYKARQARPNRLVALKMVLAGHLTDEARHRFHVETEAVGRLQHPNIVQVHEVGEHAGQPYYSMEYVEGDNLSRHCGGNPFPAGTAAAIIETLAQAMAHAHGLGIIHRDLKPSNVLIASAITPSSAGQTTARASASAAESAASHRPALIAQSARITDFGLAKQLDSDLGQTRSGTIVGTPSYMAPEQGLGQTRAIGPAADIYALGAMLYELLTGRPPFRADTTMNTLIQVIHDEPVPPRRMNPRLPRDVEVICLKCLEKDPRRRYDMAAALAEDLRRFQIGMPIQARPLGVAARGWRWCRRNPIGALAGGLAFVLVVGFVAALGVYARQQTRAATELAGEQAATLASLRTANANRALLTIDRALALAERGERGDGAGDPHKALLWLARALEIAPADDERLQRVLRANLANLGSSICTLNRQFSVPSTAFFVAFTADGQRLVAAGGTGPTDPYKNKLTLWDLTTDAPLQVLDHGEGINALAVHPRGDTIVTAGADKKTRLWLVHVPARPIAQLACGPLPQWVHRR